MPSSVIHGMRYVPGSRALDIVFHGKRGTYRYFDVKPAEWEAFKRAPSKGTYLNASFKPKHLRYAKLGALPAPDAATNARAMRDVPDENVWGFFENTL